MAENITGTGAFSRRDFLTGSAVAAAGAAYFCSSISILPVLSDF